MPMESEAQRRFMHAQHPEIAERWERHTPKGADLPERKHYNARNFEDSTYDDILEDSHSPFVSPDPMYDPYGEYDAGLMPVNNPPEAMLSTLGTAVHVTPEGEVKTRFKHGPTTSSGLGGGTVGPNPAT